MPSHLLRKVKRKNKSTLVEDERSHCANPAPYIRKQTGAIFVYLRKLQILLKYSCKCLLHVFLGYQLDKLEFLFRPARSVQRQ